MYVRGVCAQHRAQSSICAEVIDCNMRYVIAFASRPIGSANSSNCFMLYSNTFYQYEYVLLSTIYIRTFGGCIVAIWAVAFIEICSSDPTFFCACSILVRIKVPYQRKLRWGIILTWVSKIVEIIYTFLATFFTRVQLRRSVRPGYGQN